MKLVLIGVIYIPQTSLALTKIMNPVDCNFIPHMVSILKLLASILSYMMIKLKSTMVLMQMLHYLQLIQDKLQVVTWFLVESICILHTTQMIGLQHPDFISDLHQVGIRLTNKYNFAAWYSQNSIQYKT